jgi:hypothetical protein
MGWIPAKALITMVFPSLFFSLLLFSLFSPENSNIIISCTLKVGPQHLFDYVGIFLLNLKIRVIAESMSDWMKRD